MSRPCSPSQRSLAFRSPGEQMGYTMLPNCVLFSSLPGGAKLLYAFLCHYARQDDGCYPGQARLSRVLSITERQLRRWLTSLVACRLVTVERRGQGLTNLYWIESLDAANLEALESDLMTVAPEENGFVERFGEEPDVTPDAVFLPEVFEDPFETG